MIGKEEPTDESSSEINAIACGVAVKLNLLSGFSEMVAQRSIEIARQLRIPDKEIQKWVAARSKLDSEWNIIIQSALNKLGRKARPPRA